MAYQLIHTEDQVQNLLSEIASRSSGSFIVFLDLEGVNLSRLGTVAIMQILVPPNPTVYLLDVHQMGSAAFTKVDESGISLKDILQDIRTPKAFFDVRNDSDALYSHFGVDLKGIIDIQVLEFATRPVRGRFVKGLAKCISEERLSLPVTLTAEQVMKKERGRDLFAPERGGRYEVFLERPLAPEILEYCAQDVLMLPGLLSVYASRFGSRPRVARLIQPIVDRRVSLSQSSGYNGKGRHMAEGPDLNTASVTQNDEVEFPMKLMLSSDIQELCRVDVTSTESVEAPIPTSVVIS